MRRIRAGGGGGGAGVTGSGGGGGGGGGTSAGSKGRPRSAPRRHRRGSSAAALATRRPGRRCGCGGNGSPRRRLQKPPWRPPPARTLLPPASPRLGRATPASGRAGGGEWGGCRRAPGDRSRSRGAPRPAPPPRAGPGRRPAGLPRGWRARCLPAHPARGQRRGGREAGRGLRARRATGRARPAPSGASSLAPRLGREGGAPPPGRLSPWGPRGPSRPHSASLSSLGGEMWRPQEERRRPLPRRACQRADWAPQQTLKVFLSRAWPSPNLLPAPIHPLIHYSTSISKVYPTAPRPRGRARLGPCPQGTLTPRGARNHAYGGFSRLQKALLLCARLESRRNSETQTRS